MTPYCRKSSTFFALAAVLGLTLASGGCATQSQTQSSYRRATRHGPSSGNTPRRTVVLFLVDGFSVPTLQTLLAQNRAPNLQQYFLDGTRNFSTARASFPTLTYPNISGILTQSSIDSHPIVGNQVLFRDSAEEDPLDSKVVNFESPFSRDTLNSLIGPKTLFSRYSEQNRTSVSFAGFFGDKATAQYPKTDFRAGVAYQSRNYEFVDRHFLGSLSHLLNGNDPEQWPEFIFVHLIGVDGHSHDSGPLSSQTLDYAQSLDARLAPIFARLKEAEAQGKEIVTLLTADHGFVTASKAVQLDEAIQKRFPQVKVLNQHRLLTFYYPQAWSTSSRQQMLNSVVKLPGVRATFLRTPNGIQVLSDSGRHIIHLTPTRQCSDAPYAISVDQGPLLCPHEMDRTTAASSGPYFISSIARYFNSPFAADAIALALDGTTFSPGNLGDHGGLTPEELFVPALVHESNPAIGLKTALTSRTEPLPSWQLLDGAVFSEPPAPSPDRSEQVSATLASAEPPSLSARNTLEFTIPYRSWNLVTEPKADGETEHSLHPEPAIGLEGEWHQYWTKLVSTSADFGFEFAEFNDKGPHSTTPSKDLHMTESFGAGSSYRFGEDSEIKVRLGAEQKFFELPGGSLDKYWIPNFGFGVKSRMLSIGLGDIGASGNLKVLFARHPEGIDISPGLAQRAGVYFEHNVRSADIAGAELSLEHAAQNSTIADQSEYRLNIELRYELSFEE